MKEYRKRRIILINKSFQFSLIAKFTGINIFLIVLSSILIYFFSDSEIQENLYTAHVTYKNMKDMLLPLTTTLSAINIAISSIVIFIFVLFASHKVAGPIYRFNNVLEAMAERDFSSTAKLRQGDQLTEISSSLNSFSENISEDIGFIRRKLPVIEKNITDSEEARKAVNEIKELLERYRF